MPLTLTCFDHWYMACRRASLVVQMVKTLPAMQETGVQSLSQEDSPEKRIATHTSVLAWRISWTEEPGGLRYMVSIKRQALQSV